MQPEDCQKFLTCNANICPLDDAWRKRVHLPGETICPYLLGSGKQGADAHYAGDATFPLVLVQKDAILARHPAIARAVQRASKTGFRSDNLRKTATDAVSAGAHGGSADKDASAVEMTGKVP